MAASPEAREVAKHFCDTTGLKQTKVTWFSQVSAATALLEAGWTKDEVVETIDYLVSHPPKNGMKHLSFVQYVINEVQTKLKAQKEMAKTTPAAPTTDVPDDDNRRKYEEQQMNISKLFKI